MSPGALLQLVAYGAQDMFLTANADITFFKISYRKHTNFGMESIEQTFNGQVDFGRRAICTLARSGDLAYRTYLQVTLPEINQSMARYARWLDYIGEQMISVVEIEIGGQRIDRHYGDWMHIWNQLTIPFDQREAYYKMVGHTTELMYITDPSFADVATACGASVPNNVCMPRNSLPETTLYVPLQFWFMKNPGLALPLIALQFHEVKINIDFRPIGECLWAVNSLDATTGDPKAYTAYQQSIVSASLYVEYIFLDTDERKTMAQRPHEYLIEQLQFTGDETVGSSSNKIRLQLNHPCKELIFVVQPDANVDYCASLDPSTTLFRLLGAQPFNYTDALDALPNAIHSFGGELETNGATAFINASGLFQQAGALDASVYGASPYWNDTSNTGLSAVPFYNSTGVAQTGSTVSDVGTFVLSETAKDMHCWGKNPVVTCKLQLNGQDRFSEREGEYFDVVQPWQHHSRHPDTGINIYSFALKPEEYQPSGSCNFSRIDNATLMLVLSAATVSGTATAKVRVYAINYNVIRITSGMLGVSYAN